VQFFASTLHKKRITLCKFSLPELLVEQFILKFELPFLRVLEKKLTHYVQVSKLSLGSDGVDLTHIATLVLLLDVTDVEEPRAVLVMCHRDTGIPRDHVVVYR
jgi:hypothetical protein